MDEQLRQKIFGLIQQDINADPSTIDPDKPIRDQIALDSMQFIGVVARGRTRTGRRTAHLGHGSQNVE